MSHNHTMVKVGEKHDRDGDVVAEVFACTGCRFQETRQ